MNYNIYPTPDFKKQFKKLYKKYKSLKDDLNGLLLILKDEPDFGIHLGHNIFKIRLAISSKGKGKSGGARVLTYLDNNAREVYLIFIYDKNQLDNITMDQIHELLKKAGLTGTR